MVSSNGVINNKVGSSISGVTNTFTVTNASNTASSAARETIVVGGGSAGDPTLNFNVSGVTNWEMGIDNSVSDNLTISQGTALGTNDVWRMTTGGIRTLPLQPAFLAGANAAQNNVTGDSTAYKAQFNTSIFDRASNFNTGTGEFTAPVTGIYYFVANISYINANAAHATGFVDIVTPINVFRGSNLNIGLTRNSANGVQLPFSCIVNLTAADVVYVNATVTGGAKVVGLQGPGAPENYCCTFAGFLIC